MVSTIMTDLDVIGDVHGHADALEALLESLGYAERGGAWRHPWRHAVFVGDLVDRGPRQLDAVDIVRRVRDAGTGSACMGNHELNAIAWAEGARPRTERNRQQHAAFLDAAGDGSALHRELVGWFATLPPWLDLPTLRVVHACWSPAAMATIAPHVGGDGALTPGGLARALERGHPVYEAVETVLKGPECDLPPGVSFHDAYGHERRRTRVSWWGEGPATFRRTALVGPDTRAQLPDTPLPGAAAVDPGAGAPVLFGHYWMVGEPALLGPRAACLDFSVAKGGRLVAYRHEGEPELDPSRLSHVAWDARPAVAEPEPAPAP